MKLLIYLSIYIQSKYADFGKNKWKYLVFMLNYRNFASDLNEK